MLKRMRRALARRWRRLWRRERRWRGVLGPITAKKERSEDGSRWAEARARFWAELHEGQREADAHRSRLHP